MRRLIQPGTNGADAIVLEDGPEPAATIDEVLVDVEFVAPAFPDLLMASGRYQVQPEPPYVPGSDFSGIIRSDSRDGRFVAGQRVAGFVEYGAAAEVLAAPSSRVFPVPDDLPLDQAACLPLNYLTAHFALLDRGNLQSGEVVLVLGASGGVGVATLQIAKRLGARTIGVVSTSERAEVVRGAGAEAVILGSDLPSAVKTLTGGFGADIVVDVVGGDVTDPLRCLRPRGRLLSVGFTSGTIPTVRLNRLLLKNIDVRGVEWGLVLEEGFAATQWTELMRLRQEDPFAPLIAATRPLADFGAVLGELQNRRSVGRTVLAIR